MVEGKRKNNDERFVQREQTHSVFYHKKNRLHYNKRAKKCEKNLPNALEMAELQQGSKLYGSFLFRMKIQDLLESFKVDPMIDSQLQCSLRQIKTCLDQLMPKKIISSFSSEYPFMHFVKTPSSLKNYNYSFQFEKPTNYHLVGSYLLKAIVPFHKNIDMCVEMPSEMFKSNDYLNYRYCNKRIAYIAEMFLQLRKSFPYTIQEETSCEINEDTTNIDIACTSSESLAQSWRPYFYIQAYKGCPFQPIILIRFLSKCSKNSSSQHSMNQYKMTPWIFRIFAVPPKHLFSLERLSPDKNCVRFVSTSQTPQVLKPMYSSFSKNKSNTQVSLLPPTPMYNGAIMQDILMRVWVERLVFVQEKFSEFSRAVQLLKVWLFVNGHNSNWNTTHKNSNKIDEFFFTLDEAPHDHATSPSLLSPVNGFLFTVICSHICLTESDVLIAAPAFHIFRSTLIWLANVDFNRFKIFYGQKQPVELSENEKNLHLKFFLFLETCENQIFSYNILWDTQLFINELIGLARNSVSLVDSDKDPFSLLFDKEYQKMDFQLSNDIIIKIPTLPKSHCILPECTIAETHEDDAKITIFWESFQRDGKQLTNAVDVLSQYHMEHPSHYHIAGMLKRLLSRALGDRISSQTGISIRFPIPSQFLCSIDKTVSKMALHPVEVPLFSWTDVHSLKQAKKNLKLGVMLGVRFLSPRSSETKHLNEASNTSWRLVDRGYSAETIMAKVFQNFWGNSSIRRFKDGSINQSIVWKPETISMQLQGQLPSSQASLQSNTYIPSVNIQIIEHILDRHLKSTFTITDSFSNEKQPNNNELLLINSNLHLQNKPILPFMNKEAGITVQHPTRLYDSLKNYLFQLTDFPLQLTDVHCADTTGFSYFADLPLYVPISNEEVHKHISLTTIIHCVLEFEKNPGWPSDLKGIFWMKIALLVALRISLKTNQPVDAEIGGVLTTQSDDNSYEMYNHSEPFLDVEMKNEKNSTSDHSVPKVVHRLKIFYPNQYLVPASQLTDIDYNIKNFYKTKLFDFECIERIRDLWWRPKLNAVLLAASLEYPCFSSTVRLASLWAASQLFPIDDVRDMISHLCLYVFLYPRCCNGRPTTAWTGFLQFLNLISHYDWENEGIYLTYSTSTPTLSRQEEQRLKAARQRCVDLLSEPQVESQPKEDVTISSESSEVPLTNKNAVRCPLFWISTPDDPHCQIIKLPNYTTSKHLCETAKTTLEIAQQLTEGIQPNKIVAKAVNYIHDCKFYNWNTPNLRYIKKNTWKHLFNPQVSQRFDVVIHLQFDSFQTTKKHIHDLFKTQGTSERINKRRFANVQKPSCEIGSNTDDFSQLLRKKICVSDDDNRLAQVAESISLQFCRITQWNSTNSTPLLTDVLNNTINAFTKPIGTVPSILKGCYETTALLQFAFKSYINSIKELLGSLADVFYDTLAVPYPTAIFLKFNPEALSLCKLSSFRETLVPVTFVKDYNSKSLKKQKVSPFDTLLQIPNIPMIFSMLLTLGMGLVHDIQLL